MRHLPVTALLIAVVMTFFALLPAAASALTLNEYEAQILALVNEERAARDLPTLTPHAKLTRAARHHSTEMGERQYFAHDSFSGERWNARIARFGYGPRGCRVWRVGETIFWGSGLCASPVNVVGQWMASPAHRRVMLTRTFRAAGVGAVECQDGYAGCDNVWFFTLDLGRRVRR
jgi:uncharacterized protein YkwD